ncbi:MAG: hypothetical protein AB1726_18855 [Planctomycetota bacterium]
MESRRLRCGWTVIHRSFWAGICLILAGCSGGGGGGDGTDDGSGVGVGADGVPIFWLYFGDVVGALDAVRETPGGQFLAAGYDGADFAAENLDIRLLATDQQGTLVWERNFGDAGRWEFARALELTADGGCVVAGGRAADNGALDALVIKTDADGVPEWESTYGPGEACAVVERPGGGFVLAGATTDLGGKDDALVLATDSGGGEDWRRTFGGADDDRAADIDRTLDGAYVVAGFTQSYSAGAPDFMRSDVHFLKLTDTGDLVWQKVKGKAPDNCEGGGAVIATADGGYLIAGAAQAQCLLMKVDKNGDTIDLGDLDITLDVPDVTQGTIDFSNAREIAEDAVSALFLLRDVGPFAGALLVAASRVRDPAVSAPKAGRSPSIPIRRRCPWWARRSRSPSPIVRRRPQTRSSTMAPSP